MSNLIFHGDSLMGLLKKAKSIIFDNTGTGLTATNAQDAITEINAHLSDKQKTIKLVRSALIEITIPASGFVDLTGYKPTILDGKTLLFTIIYNWSTSTKKVAFNVTANGQFLMGTGGDTITGLVLQYFYID